MDRRRAYNGLIADNIKRLRQKHGLSQRQLVIKLQMMGIDYTNARISQIELKLRPPTAVLIVALKCLFGCEYSDFFGETEADFEALLK